MGIDDVETYVCFELRFQLIGLLIKAWVKVVVIRLLLLSLLLLFSGCYCDDVVILCKDNKY